MIFVNSLTPKVITAESPILERVWKKPLQLKYKGEVDDGESLT